MIKQTLNFVLLSIVFQSFIYAQTFNKTDENGERHGPWRKFYEGTQQLRYEGTFEHGKEVGAFKFYDEDSGKQPTAIKSYTSGEELIDVSMYTKTGKKISAGTMKGRSRQGLWEYYHQDGKTVMTTEHYRNNDLEGEKLVYYMNGQLAQKIMYASGKKQGEEIQYTEKGIILKRLYYENDKLSGPAKFYDADGGLLREGNYKANMRHGTWKYYVNGKLEKTEKFPKNKIGL